MKSLNISNQFFIVVLIFLFSFRAERSTSQGCVAVRQMGGLCMLSSNSYNLNTGDFQIGMNYRYFHSWRHFIGNEEQPQRQTTGGGHDENGVDRGNAVNIYSHAADLNFSYALTNRLQVNFTLPYVHNERSQVLRQTSPIIDTFRYSVYAHGIADVRASVNYWLLNPDKIHERNIMIGLGLKLPTGNHNAKDNAPQADGTIQSVTMDQAIQPGDGGLGFSVELQAFTQIYKKLYGFANGYYLFNPKESNGTFKSPPKKGLEGYNVYACPDQYFARAGFMGAVDKNNSLTLSLALRYEGIPAYDAIGGQVAYRRPGYVVAVESGVSYRVDKHLFTLFIPCNFIKNRVKSAADIADQNLQNSTITDPSNYVNVHGDAAFADYSISFGYTYRFSHHNKMKTEPSSINTPD
jgi:hypothetical protein